MPCFAYSRKQAVDFRREKCEKFAAKVETVPQSTSCNIGKYLDLVQRCGQIRMHAHTRTRTHTHPRGVGSKNRILVVETFFLLLIWFFFRHIPRGRNLWRFVYIICAYHLHTIFLYGFFFYKKYYTAIRFFFFRLGTFI